MDRQKERFKWRKVLDHLKEEHGADTNKAEDLMNLLAQDKEKHWFVASVTWIWWDLCNKLGLSPKEVLKEVEEEL